MQSRMTIGVLLACLFSVAAVANAGQSNLSVTIPKVSSYPTTTLSFHVSRSLMGSHIVSPSGVRVQFDNPDWSATVTEANWKTAGPGTFFKLTCDSKSAACLKATGSSGTYKYVLLPEGSAAPMKNGTYALDWDVRPPGDGVSDVAMITPEPGTLALLAMGLIGLFLLARKRFGTRQPGSVHRASS